MEILLALFIFGQIPVTYADTTWTTFGANNEHTHFQKMVGAMEDAPVIKWSYHTGDMAENPGVAVADVDGDGATEVVAGCVDKSVYCFDGATGIVEWQYSTGGSVWSSPAVADVDGNGTIEIIIATSSNQKVFCLDGATGGMKWSYSVANFMLASPAVADLDADGIMEVLIAQAGYVTYCLNGATGALKWTYGTGGITSPAIADVDGDGAMEAIVGGYDNKVYSLNGTGAVEWSYLTGDDVNFFTAADTDGDGVMEVVVGSKDGKVYCLTGINGALEWSRSVGGEVRGDAAVADMDEDGVIEIIVGSGRMIYCLNGATGVVKWNYDTGMGGSVIRGISVADIDGEIADECKLEVFIPNVSRDYLTCLNGEDGSVLWTKGGMLSDIHDITIADIDDDGCVELILGTQGSHRIWALDDVGDLDNCTCGGVDVEESNTRAYSPIEFKAMGKGIYLFTPKTIQVDINVYDVSGRLEQAIYKGVLNKGGHTFIPNIKSSGVYFVTLQSHNFKQSLKIIRF